MKNLNMSQRTKLYDKRNKYMLSMNELAVILSCNEMHIINAQLGKSLPNEIYDSIITWIS